MTLRDTIMRLTQVAARQPAVHMIVENDVYRLNELQNVRYGVFAFTEGRHPVNLESSEDEYRLTLFYVDRLREDDRNRVEIHSTGMQTIANILRMLQDEDFVVSTYTVQPFDERFKDNCSGVFVEVSLSSLRSNTCAEVVEVVSVLPPDLYFERLGGVDTIQVVSTTPWSFGEVPDWLTISPNRGGVGTTAVEVKAAKNPAFAAERSADIAIISDATEAVLASLNVRQQEGFAVFVVPESLYFGWSDTADQTLKVTANAAWVIIEAPKRATISATSGASGDTDVEVSFKEQNTGIDRASVIVFECGDATATVHVEHEGLREVFDDADGEFLDESGAQIWVVKQKYSKKYGI